MKRFIYAVISVSLLATLSFGQAMDEASLEELKEQIKAEVIEELKAEFILIPKETTQAESDARIIDAESVKPVKSGAALSASEQNRAEKIDIADEGKPNANYNINKRQEIEKVENENAPAVSKNSAQGAEPQIQKDENN